MVIHGAERYVVPEILDWPNRLKWTIMERTMLPFVDCVISVSSTMTEDFCRAVGFPEAKVRTIYLGVDESFTKLDETDAWERTKQLYRIPANFLLFVGHLFPNKNLENLLRGFRLIAGDIPHDLLIVGGRRWKYSSAERLILELGLERRVRSLGVVSQADLVILYNLASCFVFPSLYELFGLAQLEAMACGCPVVASRTGALPEIGGDAADLLRSVRSREHRWRDPQPRDGRCDASAVCRPGAAASQAVHLGQLRAADARGPGNRGGVSLTASGSRRGRAIVPGPPQLG